MMKQLGAMAALAAVTMVAACGGGGGGSGNGGDVDVEAARPPGFAATREYLAAAADDLATVPHRFEMSSELGIISDDGDVRGFGESTISGEFDGERIRMTSDGGFIARGESEQIIDLTGETIYIHAPDADDQVEELPDFAVTDFMEAVAELGDSWGRVDIAELADVLPAEWEDWKSQASQLRLQGLDPESFVRLVADAESVEELPAEEIDGEPMVGLAATVTAEDVAAAQQAAAPTTTTTTITTPADSEPVLTLPEGIAEDLAERLGSLEYQVEAWIDGEGRIRHLELMMNSGPMADDAPGMGSVLTLDLFDYDDSIRIELPDPDDTEDLTAAFGRQFDPQ